MGNTTSVLPRAAALGAVGGMRSMMPLALLGLAARRGEGGGASLPQVLASPGGSALLLTLAATELVLDKMPFVGSRLEPQPLFVRACVGAASGALLAKAAAAPAIQGAVAGTAGAMVGAFAGYHIRASLDHWTGLPDPIFGALEDAAAVSLGSQAVGLRIAE